MREGRGSLFAFELGRVLRRVRTDRSMRLGDVAAQSDGRFKASALGSYERGERTLSLERFVELAFLYEIPPATLLRRVLLGGSSEPGRVAVDRGQLDLVPWPEREWLAELTDRVATRRGSDSQAVVAVREDDVAELAAANDLTTAELTKRCAAALIGSNGVVVVEDVGVEPGGETRSGSSARAG